MEFMLTKSVYFCGCSESRGGWKTGGRRLDHRVGINRTLAESQQKASREDYVELHLKL